MTSPPKIGREGASRANRLTFSDFPETDAQTSGRAIAATAAGVK